MTITKIYLGLTEQNGELLDEEEVIDTTTNLLSIRLGIEGCSIHKTIGLWKGNREFSLIIELWDVPVEAVTTLAKEFKIRYNQESVVIVSHPVHSLEV